MSNNAGARPYTKPLTEREVKDWTEEEITLLRKLAHDGLAGSQIAKKLGRTRSGVCGKAARIGVRFLNRPARFQNKTMPHTSTIRYPPAAVTNVTKINIKIKKSGVPSPPIPAPPPRVPTSPVSKNLELSEMNNDQCRFPNRGDDRPILFCGNPTDGSSCWCAYHRKIVYTKVADTTPYEKRVLARSGRGA